MFGLVTSAVMDAHELAAAIPADLLVDTVSTSANAGEVVDLTHDSREVRSGWAFACVVGEHHDGHAFAARAVDRGARALLVERPLALAVDQIVVRDVRRAMGHAAAGLHGRPSTRLRLVGVTGTNGKTTTTHLIGAILRAAGRDTRELGTLSGVRTTPEAPDLQRRLAGFVAEGVDATVMEVSSHALALHRVAGCRFAVGLFTNLGRDHLDLHDSIEAYFRAKASLFAPELTDVGVTNVDDPYGRLLLDVAAIEMVPFSIADASDVEVGAGHHSFVWRGHRVRVPIGGRFNVANSLAALTTADVLGVDVATAAEGLAACPPVPGRFELVSDPARDEFAVVVDYAHTPDGLEGLLEAARALAGRRRVIVVFGCGGDRDREKRPLMGAAAARSADVVVVTSDNPRHEDADAIIAAVVAGVDPRYRGAVRVEADRRAAIGLAVEAARPGDVVVIAGKGHETSQTIGDIAHPFDDRTVARTLLDDATGAAVNDSTAPPTTGTTDRPSGDVPGGRA